MPLEVHMKGFLPWLVRWALLAGSIDFCPALVALVSPDQNIIFPRPTLFPFVSPHRSAIWAGSRTESSVSVSLVESMFLGHHQRDEGVSRARAQCQGVEQPAAQGSAGQAGAAQGKPTPPHTG